jgi:hypothetical protein
MPGNARTPCECRPHTDGSMGTPLGRYSCKRFDGSRLHKNTPGTMFLQTFRWLLKPRPGSLRLRSTPWRSNSILGLYTQQPILAIPSWYLGMQLGGGVSIHPLQLPNPPSPYRRTASSLTPPSGGGACTARAPARMWQHRPQGSPPRPPMQRACAAGPPNLEPGRPA